jgi:putative transposase
VQNDGDFTIVQSWQRNWPRIIPFFVIRVGAGFALGRGLPGRNTQSDLHHQCDRVRQHELRKVTKSCGSFPNDDALIKLYYRALRNISKKWTMPIHDWKAALNRFTILFDGRMPQQ